MSSWYNSSDDIPKLNVKGIEAIMQIEGVEMVIPDRVINAYVQFGKKRTSWALEIFGLSGEEMEAKGYEIEEGRNIMPGDKDVMVMGKSVLTEFYKGKEPVWSAENPPIEPKIGEDELEILVGNYNYSDGEPEDVNPDTGKKIDFPEEYEATLVGVFGDYDYNTAYKVFVPLELFNELKAAKREYELELNGEEWYKDTYGKDTEEEAYDNADVKVSDEDLVVEVQEKITEMGYTAYSNMSYVEDMQQISGGIQALLGGIGAVSLFVAAIGITNTMMMATYERTREIGIMKVIGAKITDIQSMFLIEALMIGAIGGGVGIVFSYAISAIINIVGVSFAAGMMGGGKLSIIPVWLAVAFVCNTDWIGIGIFSGEKSNEAFGS
ncbi:ABC transporter permease [Candidatus Epulonipiscium viviparus]|uniref:ABC transporter permease n=1 Tax=Candidatus Epulonipiscium viviparus TaxID=420336 RepID=UPI00273815CF|nr:ABC transporter permease [Candidatus Epulopiscium viviparus]